MANVERYLPRALQGMPPEDWRYIGAALLGAAGIAVWVAAIRTRRSFVELGDRECPEQAYMDYLVGRKNQSETRAHRAWLYAPLVRSYSKHWGVPADLMAGLVHTESGWKPTAGSHAGAVGLTQFMPKTAVARYTKLVEQGQWPFKPLTVNNDPQAADLFRERGVERYLDRTNPQQSVWLGASGMRSKFDRGWDVEHALASYNAGEGRVKRDMPSHEWPEETQRYVPGVLRRAAWYRELWELCRQL